MVEILKADAAAIERAGAALQRGSLVAFPTETVYGLGADATSDEAVAAIFAAKGRPSYNPLIVHVADLAAAQRLGQFNHVALDLAARFWPGPLTLVVPQHPASPISALVTAELSSIAIRVPAHPIARELLAACQLPIAAPSANRSGHVSPTTPAHVADDLGGGVALILDGGACQLGLESTVLDVTGTKPVILRPGGLCLEDIDPAAAPARLASLAAAPEQSEPGFAPRSPGLLASHYAPRAALRLNALDLREGEALLAFGDPIPSTGGPVINLSTTGNLNEVAANLFAALRRLDALGAAKIAVMPIPARGIGLAINDRLTRAAAPRPHARTQTPSSPASNQQRPGSS